MLQVTLNIISFHLFDILNGKQIKSDFWLLLMLCLSLQIYLLIEQSIALIKEWDHISMKANISKEEFIIAVNFINSTFFSFNQKIYKQVFGTPI